MSRAIYQQVRVMTPNSSIALRRLTKADQDLLWDALYVALWDPPESLRRPRSVLSLPQIACYVEDWSSQPLDMGFVAVAEDGVCLGVVWQRLLLPPQPGGAFYDLRTPQLGIAVFENFQGQGVGTKLLDQHLETVAPLCPAISLGVHPANHVALRLYHAFGFTQFATGAGDYLNMVRSFRE